MITSVEIENWSSCDPGHASLRDALSTESSDLIQSTCVHNLTTLDLAVLEISFGAQKFRMRHVTLTMSLLRV